MQTRPLKIGPAAALKVTVHACHNILRTNERRGPRGLPFVSPHVVHNLCPFKWGEPTMRESWLTTKNPRKNR